MNVLQKVTKQDQNATVTAERRMIYATKSKGTRLEGSRLLAKVIHTTLVVHLANLI